MLTAALMGEATRQRSAAEFSEALERLGSSGGVSPGSYQTRVTFSMLERNLDETVELMVERIMEPAFTEEDFERIKTRTVESLLQARKSGPALASRAVDAVLLGADHPLSYPSAGLPSTLENITLDDVREFYQAHIPSRLRGVIVSTSLPLDDVIPALDAFAALEVAESSLPEAIEEPQLEGRTIYLVDKQDAAQSSLRIAHSSLTYDALGDFYLAWLMNFPLGGTFDSRINLNLREDKGYTYGIRSGFSGAFEHGRFSVSGEVNQEATADSIREVLAELERYRDGGMDEEEFDYMQSAIGQREARAYETPGAKIGLVNRILTFNLPLDYRQQQKTLLRETDRSTLNELAKRLLQPENLAIVVVGDQAEIMPQLEELGIPILRLDAEGYPITDSVNGSP